MVNALAVVIAVAALGVGLLALRRVDVVEGRARRWMGDPDRPQSAPESPPDPTDLTDLRRRIERLEGSDRGLSRVAVVRYDAFEDVGGRLSFSAALLDDEGRGLVLTAIHGRSETRSYVKQVPPEPNARELSPEEAQAVAEAASAGGVR